MPLPTGHSSGFRDCFEVFVADTSRRDQREEPTDGLPTFERQLRHMRGRRSLHRPTSGERQKVAASLLQVTPEIHNPKNHDDHLKVGVLATDMQAGLSEVFRPAAPELPMLGR
ncbi:hypothetical protein L1085_000565 [Streptomyces sp. MSC1_001]|uniref:hypothetical protein n=1 Tax=Streptomyces sp. MSC1_001 TaxID=2909263 RepID=UPI00202FF2AD|nr:hypothetical protein [Streptomyces sp. MSC1_001]